MIYRFLVKYLIGEEGFQTNFDDEASPKSKNQYPEVCFTKAIISTRV